MAYQAEYIWLDGYQPTPMLRSKTKILADDVTDPPIWGFDGSSTEQATGDKSDCVLRPVFSCPDPIPIAKTFVDDSVSLFTSVTFRKVPHEKRKSVPNLARG